MEMCIGFDESTSTLASWIFLGNCTIVLDLARLIACGELLWLSLVSVISNLASHKEMVVHYKHNLNDPMWNVGEPFKFLSHNDNIDFLLALNGTYFFTSHTLGPWPRWAFQPKLHLFQTQENQLCCSACLMPFFSHYMYVYLYSN